MSANASERREYLKTLSDIIGAPDKRHWLHTLRSFLREVLLQADSEMGGRAAGEPHLDKLRFCGRRG